MKFIIDFERGIYHMVKFESTKELLAPLLTNILNFKDGLLSFSQSKDEISLIIRDDMIQPGWNSSGQPYKLIQLNTLSPGLEESGILFAFSKKMTERKIPFLCLSTFNLNYILYPEHFHQQVVEMTENDPDIQ
jgi:hypothetical protein